MSKIDCSITVNFFKEKERLTKNCTILCTDCPLDNDNNKEYVNCTKLIGSYTEKAVEILQKWSDENPVKTRRDDFTEKYPNHTTNSKGMPVICCKYLGYTDKCPSDICKECWDMPL